MKTPIYTTAKNHGIQAKRKRRRIGQLPEHLKNELKSMDKFERARLGISVGLAMVTLLNT